MIEEINRLQRQNSNLEKELSDLRKAAELEQQRPNTKWKDGDFDLLVSLLGQTEISSEALGDGRKVAASVLRITHALRDQLIVGVTNQAGMSDLNSLLFFNVLPKLQVHGLATLEKVAGVRWQRYKLSDKGLALLAYIDRNNIETAPGRYCEEGDTH